MGGYWVMMECQTEVTKLKFQENSVMKTWFSHIQLASSDFNTDERVTWVEIEGVPLKMWSKNTFNHEEDSKVGSYEEVPNGEDAKNVEDLDGDSDGEIVSDTNASVGNSGEILCVWDPNMFKKTNSTVSDYFVMVRGDWMPNGKKLLIISVYAPQELSEKKMLWDYLSLVMSNWEGYVVIMGDFNEVRNKSERFGTLCNRHGADSLLCSCPNISSITLDRKIRMWNKLNKEKSHKSKRTLLAELADCDAIIDNGEGKNNVVNRRTEVVNLLQEVEKKNSLEAAQKAKIKWAIDGDENSKYYLGVINKKRNQLSIRGILVEGTWIDSPSLVKSEFLSHFKNQFEQPNSNRLHMNMHFSNTLSSVQVADLECQVSKEEIKKAVWDCEIDNVVGLFKGIELALSLNLSYMFYADDVIFMGQWSIFVEDDKVKQAAAKIGCNTLKTPFSYLGSKVGGCMPRIQSWNETIERMACRLSKWKLKTLSFGGRLTLFKFVLEYMPIYHMSLFKVPKKVLYRMESIRSHFFNSVELSSKKSVWVKWKHALASKDKGGLGVSSLLALNRALMFKWVWRFITQGFSLWARVIKALHGYNGKIGQKVKYCYPSLWLDIIHEAKMFKSRGLDVSFRRPLRGGVELQQFEDMKEKVEGCVLADMMDRWF
nr:RNA-directed DNA polymerase, eukaryota, reverse transcriptase zinc-binding domain protein [Tanacetum cinerariifolium]